jgi:Na+/H+-dicarboxylate symporter
VLANYRLTLFTGKNPYLLGLDSTADVLEALVLAVLVGLGAAVARDAEEEL